MSDNYTPRRESEPKVTLTFRQKIQRAILFVTMVILGIMLLAAVASFIWTALLILLQIVAFFVGMIVLIGGIAGLCYLIFRK